MKNWSASLLTLCAACAVVGCGNGRPAHADAAVRGPEGGVLSFDAAMIARGDAALLRDTGPRDGGATDAATSGATDRRLFVPDVPHAYDGTLIDPGIEIVAFTVWEDPVLHEPFFLVSVRNVSTNLRLCALDMTTHFFDASDVEIGLAQGLVRTPLHRGVSGTGQFASACLLPGETGIQDAMIRWNGTHDAADIARLTWEDGAINLTDAVASHDLTITGMRVVLDSFDAQHIAGAWENHTTQTIRFPQVWAFGLNAVGRPIFTGDAIDSISVPRGGTWNFQTTFSFVGDYASLTAFPNGNDT